MITLFVGFLCYYHSASAPNSFVYLSQTLFTLIFAKDSVRKETRPRVYLQCDHRMQAWSICHCTRCWQSSYHMCVCVCMCSLYSTPFSCVTEFHAWYRSWITRDLVPEQVVSCFLLYTSYWVPKDASLNSSPYWTPHFISLYSGNLTIMKHNLRNYNRALALCGCEVWSTTLQEVHR